MSTLQEFTGVSGLMINQSETSFITKNLSKDKNGELSKMSVFKTNKKGKYLGIVMTNRNIDLFQNNYIKLWTEIKRDLASWSKIHLSFSGRIGAIKMSILPRVLYLLQNIPITSDMPKSQGKLH